MGEDLLMVDEVAEYLRVSPKTVYRFIARGDLRAAKIGKEWRVKREDLHSFLREKRAGHNVTTRTIDPRLKLIDEARALREKIAARVGVLDVNALLGETRERNGSRDE